MHTPYDTNKWMLCPQCDLMVKLPNVSFMNHLRCPRCDTVLKSNWCRSCNFYIIYACITLFMFILSNSFPFIDIKIAGIHDQILLNKISKTMIYDGYTILAAFFFIFVQCIPAFCICTIILILIPIKIPVNIKVFLARCLLKLRCWNMSEIFMASLLISFVKIMNYSDVHLNVSFWFWCLFCMLQLRLFQQIDRRWLWQHIKPIPQLIVKPITGIIGLHQGLRSCPCCTAILPLMKKRCTRCNALVEFRRKNSLQCTLALLLTSLIIYIPVNIIPFMVTEIFNIKYPASILNNIFILWDDGDYLIASLIFIVSVIIPLIKIIAIAFLCWNASGNGKSNIKKVNFIYEIIKFFSRWSMIDVFIISFLCTVVHIGKFLHIYPSYASILFTVVIILTMFSEITFDPRLIWDRIYDDKNKGIHN
ncbi:MAG: PqiA/YebS family transporter subunit [Pantoea sp. Brub]|nr:PqiA/YebS family transporter subunit [Pantoea sp. Brub]